MPKTIKPPVIEYWRSVKDNHWYGRIRSRSKIIWKTSEGDGYSRRTGVLNAIKILVSNGLMLQSEQIKDPNA